VHELSLALEVCRIAEAVLEREGGRSIRGIGVEVGDDAGIELESFRFCLDALVSEPPFVGGSAKLLPGAGSTLRLAFVEVDDGRPDD
jgi:Zn finger protein HypA/HybF involved in hydrogenase expression